MSNSWKLLGLGCISQNFLTRVSTVRAQIVNLPFPTALETIDEQILVPFRCPLGHLEAQNFYDTIFNLRVWERLQQIQGMRRFVEINDPLRNDEYCRLIGLACTDPWRGENQAQTGFRHKLRANPTEAATENGFFIDPDMADKITQGMTDGVMGIMEEIAADWEEITFFNVTERDTYPRFNPVFPQIPFGWVKRQSRHSTQPKASRS